MSQCECGILSRPDPLTWACALCGRGAYFIACGTAFNTGSKKTHDIGNVVPLKRYVNELDIEHVMHEEREIQQVYACPVCGELQVISGVTFHPQSIEAHNRAGMQISIPQEEA